jgi:penicillin G amidase
MTSLETGIYVIRDTWGIPHIRARSLSDAFFAQGFIHAQDRLWQMEWDRRRAAGRTAELIGKPGLEADRLARRLQIGRAAQADWEILNDETRAMVESYTAGVNAYIDRQRIPALEFETLGIEPARWQPWDCIGVFKIRHVFMGNFYDKLWRMRVALKVGIERAAELFFNYRDGLPLILPPGEIYRRTPDNPAAIGEPLRDALYALPTGGGSNSWVVDGTLTVSGKPMLASDPHRTIDVPNVYYQHHLACDAFDAIGVSIPGVPGFSHFGHTARVAWAITHAQLDSQDLYVERFDPHDASRYVYQGEWHRAETTEETISVKGEKDWVEQVRRTRHGVVIQDAPWKHHAIALRYTGFQPDKTFECFLPMLRAQSAEEFRQAQREWVDAAQNLIFADTDGNIGYHTRGKLPIRSRANGWLPVPGWTGQSEWSGIVPFDEMPQAANPAAHYIATANHKIVDDTYPHYISVDFNSGFRARRIGEMLGAVSRATADDFAAMQADRLSVFAREFVPHLVSACDDPEFWRDQPAAAQAVRLLKDWDYRLEPASVGASIYAVSRDMLMRALMEPKLGKELGDEMFSLATGGSLFSARLRGYLPESISRKDPALLRSDESDIGSWAILLRAAVRDAVMTLTGILGPDIRQWEWGRLHITGPAHPLAVLPQIGGQFNPPRVSFGGDGDTVQVSGYYPALGYAVAVTQVYRQIIDLGDIAHARWVVPLGVSGHPNSPHYADQVTVWQKNQHIPMLYDWKEIEANAESQTAISR